MYSMFQVYTCCVTRYVLHVLDQIFKNIYFNQPPNFNARKVLKNANNTSDKCNLNFNMQHMFLPLFNNITYKKLKW